MRLIDGAGSGGGNQTPRRWPLLTLTGVEALADRTVRLEAIRRARAAIAEGVLDTPACVEAAADGLADQLCRERALAQPRQTLPASMCHTRLRITDSW